MFEYRVRPVGRSVFSSVVAATLVSSTILTSAFAGPVDGQITSGSGSVSQIGNTTQIDQTSNRLIIEWQSFDTSAQERVVFSQPSSDAWALNRVLSGQATHFDGSLFANGNVIITNGSGIHFGPNAMVDVGTLIASSSGISNSNFLNDSLIFDQVGSATAMVTNAGTISVKDTGLAALVAPGVENSGFIQANLGTVILGAGEAYTLDFYGDGLIQFAITEPTSATPKHADGSDADALVENSGTVIADGGTVIMTAAQAGNVLDNAINMSGIVQANTVGTRGGKIIFGGGSGRTQISGSVSATTYPPAPTIAPIPAKRGGAIYITGETIEIADSAEIDASGADGGGTILIGGDYQGSLLTDDQLLTGLINATTTTIADGATINASASDNGDGGQIVVWGDELMRFSGSAVADGGANSGNGGDVELSGHSVWIDGKVSVNAVNGVGGTYLIDPGNACIAFNAVSCSVAGSWLDAATVLSTLNTASAGVTWTLMTNAVGPDEGDITIVDDLAFNTSNLVTVELQAHDDFIVNGAISDAGAGLNIVAYADTDGSGEGGVFINNSVTTNGGYFAASGNVMNVASSIITGGGNIALQADAMDISAALNAGAGDVSLQGLTAGQQFNLGGADAAGSVGLTDAELDFVAASMLSIGDTRAGNITFTNIITPAGIDTLSLITGNAVVDGNAAGADIQVANLALQAVNGIGSTNTLEISVNTVAAINTNSGSIELMQTAGSGDLTVGTVDGVVGISSQDTAGASDEIRITALDDNLIINNDISSASNFVSISVGLDNLLDNNAAISTAAGAGIALTAASMALEDGTITANSPGRVYIHPFSGKMIELGTTSNAGAALQLSDAELNTITAGTLEIGVANIGDISITGHISPANVDTLSLVTGGSVDDNFLGLVDVTNLAIRAGTGIGNAGDAFVFKADNFAFENIAGIVNAYSTEDFAISEVDSITTSFNSGTNVTDFTDISVLGVSKTLTFAADLNSSARARFGATTIDVNNGVTIDTSAGGTLSIEAETVNLDGNLVAIANGLTGNVAVVNVLGSTGGAEIQDAVDIVVVGSNINVAAGSYDPFVVDTAGLTISGVGESTIVNAASPAVTIAADGTILQNMLLQGTGSANDIGVLLDGQAAANLTGIEIINVDFSNLYEGVRTRGNIGDGSGPTDVIIRGNGSNDKAIFEDFGLNALFLADGDADAIFEVRDIIIRDGSDTGLESAVTGISLGFFGGATIQGTEISGASVYGVSTFGGFSGVTLEIGGTGTGEGNSISAGSSAVLIGTATDSNLDIVGNSLLSGGATGITLFNVIGGDLNIKNNAEISSAGNQGIYFSGAIAGDANVEIDNNLVTSRLTGIEFRDGIIGSAVVSISDTQIGTMTNPVGARALEFGSISGSAAVTLSGTNNLYATHNAIFVDGLHSSEAFSISSGNYSSDIAEALLVTNFGRSGNDGTVDIGAAHFFGDAGSNVVALRTSAATTGLDVTFSGAVTLSGGGTGLYLYGPGIDVQGDTFGGIAFSGQSGNYIELAGGAEFLPGSPTILDATSVLFDGTLGSAMTSAQLFATEDKLLHFPDDATLGLINISDLFVINGKSIQTAVNAAGLLAGPQTVTVGSGTFGGSVEVWVNDLTLQGRADGTTIIDAALVDAFANDGDVDNGFGVYAVDSVATNAGDVSGTSAVSGVTIDGFAFNTSALGANTGIVLGQVGALQSAAAETTISNSSFDGLENGVAIQLVNGTTLLDTLAIANISSHGILFTGPSGLFGDTVLIQNSDIEAADNAIQFDSGSYPGNNSVVTIHNNRIVSTAGDAIQLDTSMSGSKFSIVGNSEIRGARHGILFDESASGGNGIVIAGNTGIYGDGGDGIRFSDTVTTNVDIGTATVDVGGLEMNFAGNDEIIGSVRGILFARSFGTEKQLTIANNGLIQGLASEGIRFGATIANGGHVGIVGNTEIRGATDGIEVFGASLCNPCSNRNSELVIAGNAGIYGDGTTGQGINFLTSIYDSEATIGVAAFTVDGVETAFAGNVEIIGGDNGILFGRIDKQGSATVVGNTLISGLTGNGIEVMNQIEDNSTFTVSDNLEIIGAQDGIVFDDKIFENSTVLISGNTAITGQAMNGIYIDQVVQASIEISDNIGIFGQGSDGILAGKIWVDADYVINGNGQIIGAINGIQHLRSLFGESTEITENTEIRGQSGSGILLALNATNSLEISDNVGIFGDGADGITFSVGSAGFALDINNNSQIIGAENGINFPGFILSATSTIDGNTEIRGGTGAGINIYESSGGAIDIVNNDGIFGDGTDGISVENSLENLAFNVSGNGQIEGAESGINLDIISGGSLTIDGNTEIRGLGADGIVLNSGLGTDIEITNNAGINGDGSHGINVNGGLVDSRFVVDENGDIVGSDDGIYFNPLLNSTAEVTSNTLIQGVAGRGIGIESAIAADTEFLVAGNSVIRGGEEGVEFSGDVVNSTIIFSDNPAIIGETADGVLINGILGSTVTFEISSVTGALNGLALINDLPAPEANRLILIGTTLTGGTGAGLYVANGPAPAAIEIDLSSFGGNVITGTLAMLLSGQGLVLTGDTLGDAVFNTIGLGNFIELADGALFAPGSPTIIDAEGALFDGMPASALGLALELRLIDFDDDATLGQILIPLIGGNLPLPRTPALGPVRTTNVQTPGDAMLRSDSLLNILPEGVFGVDYRLGDCAIVDAEDNRVRCIVQPGVDISPYVAEFMAKLPIGEMVALNRADIIWRR